jgi:hypothetical protein
MKRCNIYLANWPDTFPGDRPRGTVSYGPPVKKLDTVFEPTAKARQRTTTFGSTHVSGRS